MAFGREDTHWSPLLLPSFHVSPSWLFVEMSNGFRLLQYCTTKRERESWISDTVSVESWIKCLWTGRRSVFISCKCRDSLCASLTSCLMPSVWASALQVRINVRAVKANVHFRRWCCEQQGVKWMVEDCSLGKPLSAGLLHLLSAHYSVRCNCLTKAAFTTPRFKKRLISSIWAVVSSSKIKHPPSNHSCHRTLLMQLCLEFWIILEMLSPVCSYDFKSHKDWSKAQCFLLCLACLLSFISWNKAALTFKTDSITFYG